jgi:exonuclease V gamma subunit
VLVGEQIQEASAIAVAATVHGFVARQERTDVALAIDGVTLTGVLRRGAAGGLVQAQFSRVGGHHELDLWIRHLVLNAALDSKATSVLVGRVERGDGEVAVPFRPVADPRRHLASLIALFQRGQSHPLPLFAHASRAYAKDLRGAKGSPARACAAARKAFLGDGDHTVGDLADANVQLLYPQPPDWGDPARSGPAAIAVEVFGPLLDHRGDR